MSDRAKIREIFLANGFTIKPGHSDLKDYVYEAAESLLEYQLAALKEENERLLRELSDAGSRIVDLEAGEEILKARMAEQSEYILRLRKSIIDATNNGVPLDSGKWVYSIDDSVLEWPSALKEPANED